MGVVIPSKLAGHNLFVARCESCQTKIREKRSQQNTLCGPPHPSTLPKRFFCGGGGGGAKAGICTFKTCPRKCRRNPREKNSKGERENATTTLEKEFRDLNEKCDHREVTREMAEILPRKRVKRSKTARKHRARGVPLHFSDSCLRDDSQKMFSEPGRFFQPYLNLKVGPPFRLFFVCPRTVLLRRHMWPKDPHIPSNSDVKRNDSQNQKTMCSARCFYLSLRLQQQLPKLWLLLRASQRQRGSNTLHSPGILTDIWPQNSQQSNSSYPASPNHAGKATLRRGTWRQNAEEIAADRWIYDRPQSRVEQGQIQRQHSVIQCTPSMKNYRNPLGTPLTSAVKLRNRLLLSELDHQLYHWHHGTPQNPNPHQILQLPWFPLFVIPISASYS